MRYQFSESFWQKFSLRITKLDTELQNAIPNNSWEVKGIRIDQSNLKTDPFDIKVLREILTMIKIWPYIPKKPLDISEDLLFLVQNKEDIYTPSNQALSHAFAAKIGTKNFCSERLTELLVMALLSSTLSNFRASKAIDGVEYGIDVLAFVNDEPSFTNPKEPTRLTIERSIEFEPQHFQAGLDILNYFGTILRDKFPNVENKIAIEQEGLAIRMIIRTPEGQKEIIEETLDAYGEVIMGRKEAKELLDDQMQVLRLQNKLEIAIAQTNMAQQQLEFERKTYHRSLLNLEVDNNYLRKQLGNSLAHNRNVEVANSELIASLIEQFSIVYEGANDSALIILTAIITLKDSEYSKSEVKSALLDLKTRSPKVFGRLTGFIEKAGASAFGRMIWEVVQNL